MKVTSFYAETTRITIRRQETHSFQAAAAQQFVRAHAAHRHSHAGDMHIQFHATFHAVTRRALYLFHAAQATRVALDARRV